MTLEFPTALFGFKSQDIDIERQILSGGTSLSNDTDVVATDGGGRLYAEFGDGDLIDRDKVLAWRATLTNLEGGAASVVVPFCDVRHQPYGGGHLVPYGDGSVHDDGTLFSGGGPYAVATVAAPLRAASVTFSGVFSRPLLGGEWFTIDHPVKGPRAYRVRSIDGSTLSFRPTLREAIDASTPLDFSNPRCLMRQDPEARSAGSAITNRRHSVASIRFIEAP